MDIIHKTAISSLSVFDSGRRPVASDGESRKRGCRDDAKGPDQSDCIHHHSERYYQAGGLRKILTVAHDGRARIPSDFPLILRQR